MYDWRFFYGLRFAIFVNSLIDGFVMGESL